MNEILETYISGMFLTTCVS